jgi:hypothetical protein
MAAGAPPLDASRSRHSWPPGSRALFDEIGREQLGDVVAALGSGPAGVGALVVLDCGVAEEGLVE